jgi:hypothetical protein
MERQDQQQQQSSEPTYFFVSTRWTRALDRFLKNDIGPYGRGTFLGASPPGPVDNSSLWDKDKGVLKEKLKERLDYICVTPTIWKFFMDVYGTTDPKLTVERTGDVDVYGRKLPGATANGTGLMRSSPGDGDASDDE